MFEFMVEQLIHFFLRSSNINDLSYINLHAQVVFYLALIVYIILSNQAFTGHIVEKPALQNSEQATSKVCVSLCDSN